MKSLILLATAALSAVASASQVGPGEQCNDLFMSVEQYHADLQGQQSRATVRGMPFDPVSGVAAYESIIRDEPAFAHLFPKREVYRILATEEMPYFERRLEQLLKETLRLAQAEGVLPSSVVDRVIAHDLHNQVPNVSIHERIAQFRAGHAPIERILGDMTLQETQTLFYGHDPLHPTPDSLLGQYLAETGASSMIRTFNMDANVPQGTGAQGPQKLAVSVDAASFPIWKKYFDRVDMLSIFAHAQVVQNGKIVSYSQNYGELRALSAGGILPAILLKTTEAQRTEFYLSTVANRGAGGWIQATMVPWKIPGYMSVPSGYETCTQWIGNMPIGDKRVDTYALPGAVDQSATNRAVPGLVDEAAPRYAKLSSHDPMPDSRLNKAYQAPGYQQFTSVMGIEYTNTSGNWANPGWVVQTLVGYTSNEFVPFVFVFSADAKAPLVPNFIPSFERPY